MFQRAKLNLEIEIILRNQQSVCDRIYHARLSIFTCFLGVRQIKTFLLFEDLMQTNFNARVTGPNRCIPKNLRYCQITMFQFMSSLKICSFDWLLLFHVILCCIHISFSSVFSGDCTYVITIANFEFHLKKFVIIPP